METNKYKSMGYMQYVIMNTIKSGWNETINSKCNDTINFVMSNNLLNNHYEWKKSYVCISKPDPHDDIGNYCISVMKKKQILECYHKIFS